MQEPDGGNSRARRGGTEAPDEAMDTAAGAGGAGYLPVHFNGAAAATTENDMHPHSEYNKVVSEALVGGQSSAGPATGEHGQGETTHSAGQTQEEGGEQKTLEGECGTGT